MMIYTTRICSVAISPSRMLGDSMTWTRDISVLGGPASRQDDGMLPIRYQSTGKYDQSHQPEQDGVDGQSLNCNQVD